MPHDRSLQGIAFISEPLVAKLGDLEIHTLLQLAARMSEGFTELASYLGLDAREYSELRRKTLAMVKEEFPSSLPEIVPGRFKSGVAVDRLDEADRPRYRGDDEDGS